VRLARREQACRGGATSYDAGTQERYDGALPVRVRRPCDETSLATSPDLPASPFEPGEQLFGEAERDQLLASLDFGLQPAWAPQPPVLRSGLAFVRFNRVEGPSLGGSATSALGRGYTAAATARLGVADLIPNAELALSRTDGRSTVRLGAFHRLAVANDDWGNPLSLGASLAAALYGRDEGFYYRAWGLELGGARPAPFGAVGAWNPLRGATLGWRLFAERQRGASLEVRRGVAGPAFAPNVPGDRAVSVGGGGDLARTFGIDPARARLATRVRGEAAWVRYDDPAAPVVGLTFGSAADASRRSAPYARAMAEATLSRPLGPLAASVTGAAGAVAGARAPAQRLFYVGGLQTVRGQFAQPTAPATPARRSGSGGPSSGSTASACARRCSTTWAGRGRATASPTRDGRSAAPASGSRSSTASCAPTCRAASHPSGGGGSTCRSTRASSAGDVPARDGAAPGAGPRRGAATTRRAARPVVTRHPPGGRAAGGRARAYGVGAARRSDGPPPAGTPGPRRPRQPNAASPRRSMRRTLCKSKIHRATLTGADLHYEGSCTVDRDLMDAADLLPFEKVQVVNVNTGRGSRPT
jgi:hypothetical protein